MERATIYIKAEPVSHSDSESSVDNEQFNLLGFDEGGKPVTSSAQMDPDNADKTKDQSYLKKLLIDKKTIDMTNIQKVVVKVDPATGKKYILRGGKRYEILPQLKAPALVPLSGASAPVVNLGRSYSRVKIKSVTKPSQDQPEAEMPQTRNSSAETKNLLKGVITSKGLAYVARSVPIITTVPRLASISTIREPPFNKDTDYNGIGINYTRIDECTMTEPINVESRGFQTDHVKQDIATQTDPEYGSVLVSDIFINYILQEKATEKPSKEDVEDKPRTREEMERVDFFNSMKMASVFDRSGNLPIHESVMQNDWKLVNKNCIVLRARGMSVNVHNLSHYTPLHLAILQDASLQVLKILLNNNADLSLTDNEGNTVFHLAVENDRKSHLRVLLKKASALEFNLDCFNFEGFTPLIMSCSSQSFEMTKMFLEAGAEPNVKDMKSGRTALFHAAENHDVNLVELLIQHKADTKIRNFFGTSPHDAMFDLDDMPAKIKYLILGRDHRYQSRKKSEVKPAPPSTNKTSGKHSSSTKSPATKKARLEEKFKMTSVLKKVSDCKVGFNNKAVT